MKILLMIFFLINFILYSQISPDFEIKSAQRLEKLKKLQEEIIPIAIIPFKNDSKNMFADKILFKWFRKSFKNKGFSIPDYTTIKTKLRKEDISTLMKIRKSQLINFGRKYGLKYIIYGKITKFKAYKKFKLGNFIIFPIGLGQILYGEIKFKVQVLDVSAGEIIYRKEIYSMKKNQVGGLFQGKGAVQNRNLKEVMAELKEELYKVMK